jgi:hypothetical protein
MTKISTRRTDAPKKPSKSTTSDQSEIIKNCVRYLQCTAGFNAGHDADPTDGEIAGGALGSVLLRNADQALNTVVDLRSKSNKPPLTVAELRAIAATCKGALDFNAGCVIEKETVAFVRLFANEVGAYLREVQESAASNVSTKSLFIFASQVLSNPFRSL